MAGFSLLTLLDNITSILDDVALMTKVAAKKTTTLLSDDLALNAQQVSGVAADRELPVVWAVAKGSLLNKLILIPVALIISAVAPFMIKPLLMVGGAYLSFEGAEKVFHKLYHSPAPATEPAAATPTAPLNETERQALEKRKVRGAIRTDFVLSAEIIVIAMGTVPANAALALRAGVLVLVGLAMTALVYGAVAGIVKLDDLGFWLLRHKKNSQVAQKLGHILLGMVPRLMRFLTIAGTTAMFLVGGGIIVHGLPLLQNLSVTLFAAWPLAGLWRLIFSIIIGVAVGGVLLIIIGTGKGVYKCLAGR